MPPTELDDETVGVRDGVPLGVPATDGVPLALLPGLTVAVVDTDVDGVPLAGDDGAGVLLPLVEGDAVTVGVGVSDGEREGHRRPAARVLLRHPDVESSSLMLKCVEGVQREKGENQFLRDFFVFFQIFSERTRKSPHEYNRFHLLCLKPPSVLFGMASTSLCTSG